VVDVDAADVAALPVVVACEARVETDEREGPEGRAEKEEERVAVGKPVPVDLDRIGEDVPKMVEMEAEVEEQSGEL
jgi:hypothetical protein